MKMEGCSGSFGAATGWAAGALLAAGSTGLRPGAGTEGDDETTGGTTGRDGRSPVAGAVAGGGSDGLAVPASTGTGSFWPAGGVGGSTGGGSAAVGAASGAVAAGLAADCGTLSAVREFMYHAPAPATPSKSRTPAAIARPPAFEPLGGGAGTTACAAGTVGRVSDGGACATTDGGAGGATGALAAIGGDATVDGDAGLGIVGAGGGSAATVGTVGAAGETGGTVGTWVAVAGIAGANEAAAVGTLASPPGGGMMIVAARGGGRTAARSGTVGSIPAPDSNAAMNSSADW